MSTNSLQANLTALQHVVAFAEGDTNVFPVLLLKAGDGFVVGSPNTLKQVRALTAGQVEFLQAELRAFLRAIPLGQAEMISPMQIRLRVTTHDATPVKGRRGRLSGRRSVSYSIEGTPRDFLFNQVDRLLPAVALQALKVCPSCGKAFVKVTKKRFCSTKCQSRIYMREFRAAERAEREQFIHEQKKTRARRR